MFVRPTIWCALVLTPFGFVSRASAQSLQSADGGPRFLSVPTRVLPSRDFSTAPVLQRRVTLELDHVTLESALAEVGRQAHLKLAFSADVIAVDYVVSVHAEQITVAAALTELLIQQGVDVQLSADGTKAALVPRLSTPLVAQRRRAAADSGRVTGRVIDSESHQPLGQAVISVARRGGQTTTGADGRYALRGLAAGTYEITARRLGYAPETRTLTVAGDSSISADFALVPMPTTLTEVVTTALGDQRRYAVGNVISTINVDSIAPTTPVTSITDLLSARAPGVDVEENSGLAGSGETIRIRGISSLVLQGDPIIIVDGIRTDNSEGGNSVTIFTPSDGTHSMHPTPARLNDIDFTDVETIDVLKGPAAATEYGTDAANGVIVITTKRAAAGPPQWRLSAEQTESNVSESFPNGYYSWGHTTNAAHTPIECPMLQAPYGGVKASWTGGTCTVDSVTQWNPTSHAATSLFTTGDRGKYDLQVSGGSPTVRYFVSGGLSNETGIVQMPPVFRGEAAAAGLPLSTQGPNSLQDRSIRANTAITLGRSADLSVTASYLDNHQSTPDVAFLLQGLGIGNAIGDSAHAYGYGSGTYAGESPLGELAQIGTQSTDRFVGGATMNWRPTGWLASHVTLGLDHGLQGFQEITYPGLTGPPYYVTPFYGLENQSTDIYTIDARATATTSLTRTLQAATSFGLQLADTRTQGQAASTVNVTSLNLSLSGATGVTTTQIGVRQATLGGYIEEQESYDNRLFLTEAVRIDAGSGFGSEYNVATYPKASVSWLAIDRGLATLRLRGAFGENGVQPTAGSALQIYNATPIAQNGQPASAYQLFWPGNPTLRPERSIEWEGGTDLTAFANRLSFQVTGYEKTTQDALVNEALGWDFGSAYEYQLNIGEIRNTGLEATLDATPIQTRPLNWTLSLNAAWQANDLVHLAPGIPPQLLHGYAGNTRQEPGYPVYGFWAPHVTYADNNHDGILLPSEVTVSDSSSYVGSSLPTREISLGTHLALWHGTLALGALVDYRGGNKLLNTYAFYAAGWDKQQEENVPGSPLWLQARALAGYVANATPDLYYEDDDFIRWRELSLTYTLPADIARLARVRGLSLTAAVRNLALLWTRYTGPDPEVSNNSGLGNTVTPTVSGPIFNNNLREDVGTVPLARYWVARLNVTL
jgi:TonB-linked SusC/RagA family outer membrane protein